MYCRNCGTKNDDNAFRCVNCSEIIQQISVVRAPSITDDPSMRLLIPIGVSPLAIIAGYLGLFSLIFFPAPFALVFGILAVIDIKKHPGRHGMGRAIFAIVMGFIFTLLLLVIIIPLIIGSRSSQ